MKNFVIRCIRLYQRGFSPFKHYSHCRFVPTCSEYAISALEKYGFFKGSFLAIKRLLRCHPFCKGGYDPVP